MKVSFLQNLGFEIEKQLTRALKQSGARRLFDFFHCVW